MVVQRASKLCCTKIRNRIEGDLRAKQVARVAAAARSILPMRLKGRTLRSAQMEQLLSRYQTPFTPEIEGTEPLEKYTSPKFNIYQTLFTLEVAHQPFSVDNGLQNHLDTLMCRVFPSSLGDLKLK